MNIKDSNGSIGISAIILAIIFVIISVITKNSLWLLLDAIILLAYLAYFFYYWNKNSIKTKSR